MGCTRICCDTSTGRWMVEDRIPEILSHERLGHELGGVGARYTHVTDSMRAELMDALTERWNNALDARMRLEPHSPVVVLDELLAARAARREVRPRSSHRIPTEPLLWE